MIWCFTRINLYLHYSLFYIHLMADNRLLGFGFACVQSLKSYVFSFTLNLYSSKKESTFPTNNDTVCIDVYIILLETHWL